MFSAFLNQPSLRGLRFRPALILTTLSLSLMSAGASSHESASSVEIGDYFKALNSRAQLFFGDTIAISGDLMLVGSTAEDGAARGIDGDPFVQTREDSGAVYVFERNAGSWAVGSYLKASNADANDYFGQSIAISGTTAVVGAILEGSSARGINGDQENNDRPESGAVYVFVQERDGWVQQAYLKSTNSDERDNFGGAVAIDGNLLVIGAPGEDSTAIGSGGDQTDNSGYNTGAVYVFRRNADRWYQIAYLKAPYTGDAFGFGNCVAVSGNRFVVGSPTEDSNATGVNGDPFNNLSNQSGAAYVYRIEGSTVIQEAYLKASNTEVDDRFGCDLAIDGDTVAVGAVREDSAARGVGGDPFDNTEFSSGAVYVFHRSDLDGWQPQAYVKAINSGRNDSFGHSLALSGNLLAVGADLDSSAASQIDGDADDNSLTSAGSAQLYHRTGAIWSPASYIKPSNPGHADRFGFSVAMDGGLLAVSAFGEDSDAIGINGDKDNDLALFSGAAYTFDVAAFDDRLFADGFEQ